MRRLKTATVKSRVETEFLRGRMYDPADLYAHLKARQDVEHNENEALPVTVG